MVEKPVVQTDCSRRRECRPSERACSDPPKFPESAPLSVVTPGLEPAPTQPTSGRTRKAVTLASHEPDLKGHSLQPCREVLVTVTRTLPNGDPARGYCGSNFISTDSFVSCGAGSNFQCPTAVTAL